MLKRIEIEKYMRKAIVNQEFTLNYQPILCMKYQQIIGLECLIRWNSPKLGQVAPSEFIPIAEETGMIHEIGEWVLREACKQNKAWQDAGLSAITVSVNLCPRQFYNPKLKDTIQRILKETELASHFLELEITESMTMDVNLAMVTLQELKKIGIKIAIDDFGTGYSSLSYLKEFPIDKLKIDQSFVKDAHNNKVNEAIVGTIIAMAHHMSLLVVAEGVENTEDLDLLKKFKCDLVQGYYFSRPVDVAKVEELLKENMCIKSIK